MLPGGTIVPVQAEGSRTYSPRVRSGELLPSQAPSQSLEPAGVGHLDTVFRGDPNAIQAFARIMGRTLHRSLSPRTHRAGSGRA